jgi:hypothetical protein
LRLKGYINQQNQVVAFDGKYKFDEHFFGTKPGEAIKERATVLNHPRLWLEVLEQFPNLIINLAHFGGSGQIMEFLEYGIPEKLSNMGMNDFNDDVCDQLEPEDEDFVRNCYEKRGRRRILKNISFQDRQRLWYIFYNADILDNWTKAIFDIIRDKRFPNAYTDLSCFTEGAIIRVGEELKYKIDEPLSTFKSKFYDKITDYERSKMLYGSDYFLCEFQGVQMKQYLEGFKNVFGDDFEQIATENPERFLGIEQAV